MMEENVQKIQSVTTLLEQGHTAESLLEAVLDGFDIEFTDKVPTEFYCNCSKERVEKALISIGRKDLNEMIQEGKEVELNCHFCNKNYTFSVDELKDMLYKKNIKAMNPRAAIYLDDVNGNSEDYARNMPLPFDVDADIIDIGPEDYGLWYIDATGDPMKYDGKTVRFLAQAYVGKDVPAGSFVPGRFGMVCCADDVTFLGFLCRYPDRDQLHNRDWVKVTASITVEELPQYRGPGPVLHAITVEPAEKAKEDIVYFN